MSRLAAGAAYFAAVFAAGFALAPIRILWLAPRLGERLAELAEMPLMLVAMVAAARWVVRRFAVPAHGPARLAVGAVGLALMLAAEFGVVLGLRGLSLAEYFTGRDPIAGAAYLAALALFAAMPLLVRRR